MKRVGNLWPEVTAFDTLLEATRRAARGKRGQLAVARFLADREPRLLELRRELRSGAYRPDALTSFVIYDPKRRTIAVAPFRDRVVHHAIIDVLEPVLDRRMVHATFACRRGKGTHAALAHVQRLVRRHAWVLRMDVERFFASIPHAVVMRILGRIVKDRAVLSLVERIVAAGGCSETPGRGLPIGNLTSQWLANLVLDPIDRLVTHRLRLRGYARYMDDWAVLADDRARLQQARLAIEDELASLGLRAKAERDDVGAHAGRMCSPRPVVTRGVDLGTVGHAQDG